LHGIDTFPFSVCVILRLQGDIGGHVTAKRVYYNGAPGTCFHGFDIGNGNRALQEIT